MPAKPKHVPSVAQIDTVKIHAHWGNLLRDTVTCGHNRQEKALKDLIADRALKDPIPTRNSFVVYHRSYNRAKDTFGDWKPVARYNHLGLEIAL